MCKFLIYCVLYFIVIKNVEKVAKNFAGYKIMSIFALEISQTLMPRWRNR